MRQKVSPSLGLNRAVPFWLYRWFKACGVAIPSEKKQRKLSHQVLGDNLESEATPFAFPLKHGGEDLRPAPLVYVPDLVAKIFQHLEQNERYRITGTPNYQLTLPVCLFQCPAAYMA